jgi:hypothetical protein
MMRITKHRLSSSSHEQAKWLMERILQNQHQYFRKASAVIGKKAEGMTSYCKQNGVCLPIKFCRVNEKVILF